MKPVDPALLRVARGIRPLLAGAVLLGVITAAATIAQALLLGSLLAGVVTDGELPDAGSVAALMVAVLLRALSAGAGDRVAARGARRVGTALREDLIRHSARLGPRHRGADSAEMATLAGGGVEAIELYLASYLPQVVLSVAVPSMMLVVLFLLDPTSGVIVLVTLPLIPLFMALVGWYTERATRTKWRALVALSSHFADVVAGLPTLKAFGRAGVQGDKVRAVTGDYRRATMTTLRVAFLSSLVLELLATLSVALVAVTIGVRLVSGNLTLQVGLAALILAPEAYLPLRTLGTRFHAAADGVEAAAQVAAVLEVPAPTIGTRTDIGEHPSLGWAGLRVRMDAERELRVPDATLPPGRILGVTGPSGAGKTTLLHLVAGTLRATSGLVTADGVPVGEVTPDLWRRTVRVAGQQPYLAAGTVLENLMAGNDGVSRARLRRALVAADAVDWVDALPSGWDTVLTDGGGGLSAGQRQRLALARALAGSSPVLLLDEPTAHLDTETERRVLAGIAEMAAGRTVVLVTHREAPLALADQVIALDAVPADNGAADPAGKDVVPATGAVTGANPW